MHWRRAEQALLGWAVKRENGMLTAGPRVKEGRDGNDWPNPAATRWVAALLALTGGVGYMMGLARSQRRYRR